MVGRIRSQRREHERLTALGAFDRATGQFDVAADTVPGRAGIGNLRVGGIFGHFSAL